jgi:DNA-binding NarL/FixJ family response regulator
MEANLNICNLSAREFQVMELVSIGKFNKEIADELHVRLCTVTKHLQHIFPKLGAQNRTEATLRFIQITGRFNKISA